MHLPVMLKEVIEITKPTISKNILDVTFGRGGHTKAFLLNGANVYVCDRDIDSYYSALHLARNNSRLKTYHTNFAKIINEVQSLKFDIIFMDLGLCSEQIISERGFSFYEDSNLDMRMGFGEISAFEVINHYSYQNLSDLFKIYGEEKMHHKIAKRIVERRKHKLFYRTQDLSNEISKCVRASKKHPATRSFQAIRIHVNNELGEIQSLLSNVHRMLKPGGQLVSIAFHSLEDRILKRFFKQMRIQSKIFPKKEEIFSNRRARSAIMRFGCV